MKFILNSKIILNQYKKLRQHCDLLSYSSKTNPLVSPILEDNTDSMFSIHLKNELVNIKDKSRVLYLAQAWNEKDIEELVSQGIDKFVVDNIPDLEILLDYLKNSQIKIELMLRLKLKENTIRTEKYFVFGIPSEKVNELIPQLSNNPCIKKLGVHFHRKTQNMSEWSLEYEVSNILSEESLSKIQIMNIGGGIPSTYANTNENVIQSVLTKISEFKTWLNHQNIELMLEPGRAISAPAGKLITKITRIYDNNIIVDASVYNTDMDALIVPVKLLIEGEVEKGEGEAYAVKGKTPCSLDLFRYRVYLKNPKEGDELVFLNAGAYNFSTDFCNLEKPETIIE